MNKSLAVFALVLAAAALAACRPDPSAPAEEDPAAAPSAEQLRREALDAAAAARRTPLPELDLRALAGNYGDGDTRLELRPDGSYVQTLRAGGSSLSVEGRWTGVGPVTLLLDPASSTAEDVMFEVVSDLELRSVDGTHTFRRDRAD